MSIEKQKLYNEIETLPEELTIQVVIICRWRGS